MEQQNAPTQASSLSNRLAQHLKLARDRLIQTGTRNRLIHSSRMTKRGKFIDIIDERSDDVFRILAHNNKHMRFDHDPTDVEAPDEGEPELLPTPRPTATEERYTDDLLQTPLGQDKLQKKLLSMAREAKTLEEEQGINVLYVAFGFLRWYEDKNSEVLREAPLVLLPVNLKRDERRSTYEVEARGEDIMTNEPLLRRLAHDQGITLPEIPEEDGWLPSDYFALVAEAIGGQQRWSIDQDGMQLGFFSFAKLLMVKDLEPENWPNQSILSDKLISGLLVDGFEQNEPAFPPDANLDELFSPADLVQIVDADASQTLVIETVRKGQNLVVQGPPGTGKSQTITNIIAAAVHDGKKVLFIAEKMAALNVVHSRLVSAGLRDVCLELHSRAANKRLVTEELGRTLRNASAQSIADPDTAEVLKLRTQLNQIASSLHKPIGKTDISAYRAVSTLVRLNAQGFVPVDYPLPGVEKWGRSQLNEVLVAAKALSEIGQIAGPKVEHPFYGVGIKSILPTDADRLKRRLASLQEALAGPQQLASELSQHLGAMPDPSSREVDQLNDILVRISKLSSQAQPFAAILASHGGLDQAKALADIGQKYARAMSATSGIFRATALTAPAAHLRSGLASGHSFFGRLGGKYKSASAELSSLCTMPLPKPQPERMALLDQLLDWQQTTSEFEKNSPTGQELLGELWKGQDTDFQALADAVEWLTGMTQMAVKVNAEQAVQFRRHEPAQLAGLGQKISTDTTKAREIAETVFDDLSLDLQQAFGISDSADIPLSSLQQKTDLWLSELTRLDEWTHLVSALGRMQTFAGDAITDAIARGEISSDDVTSTIRFIHAEALYRLFANDHHWLIQLTSDQKSELIAGYRTREKARWKSTAQFIRGSHAASMPSGGMGAMGFIRSEIGKKTRHKPIRTLVRNAGPALQQIKPVMLMSPISLAQYAPPRTLNFDLLVIDEASQVRPEDAIGAIARANQIVVVGDRKQLPPTSFFDRVVADDDIDELEDDETENAAPPAPVTAATEMESVLTLCEARGLNSRMLEWHYRSRTPSLIEVSNENFYEGRLVLFPSPSTGEDGNDGLKMRRVNGAYDRGGKRHNVIEAEAVARAVAEHARKFPNRTLGVVTFSSAQRNQVEFWLDKLRQTDDVLADFLQEGVNEEFFVKSIENVQGDERDVIFISVGYGPRVAGNRLESMSFGPVSSEHGERRLNVLFTRARYKTEVFCSFGSGDIDTSRTKNIGAAIFRRFLYAAETGFTLPPVVLDEDPDSDFEVSVARAIRALGYEVDHQVGSKGFKIDLAIRHPQRPGSYLLAVECDGQTYHSAIWARERDRQRQEVLESLGWKFHRVWSTDWFHRKEDEIQRLSAAIEAALSGEIHLVEVLEDEIDYEVPADPINPNSDDMQFESALAEYKVASFPVSNQIEPHLVPNAKMSEIAKKIIEIEGPMHQDEIARRVASLFNKLKAGSRIANKVDAALTFLKSSDASILCESSFWFTHAQRDDVPLRNRSAAPPSLRKANMIPPIEIAAAIRHCIKESGALQQDEVPRAVALLFGFQRTGPEFRPAVEPVVDYLIENGKLTESAAGLMWIDVERS